MIPSPPVFNATLTKRPVSQRKVAENNNEMIDRVIYLLSGMRRPPDAHVIVCLHDSEPVVQDGPMCGLVAVSMASKLIHGCIVEQASPSEMLLKARQLEYTKHGEIFSAENLLKLSLEQLKCSGSALIFPYDCDKNHMPCKLRGHKAHWAICVGFALTVCSKEINKFLPFCDDKIDYYLIDNAKLMAAHVIDSLTESSTLDNAWLFCRHGKSRHVGLWPLQDIVESNGNLLELQPNMNSSNCVIPTGSIREGLCGKAVLLEKRKN